MTILGTDHQNFCDISISASHFLLQTFSVVGSAQPHKTKHLIDAMVSAFFLRQLTKNEEGDDAIYYDPNNSDYSLKPRKEDFYSLMGDQPLTNNKVPLLKPLGETERLIQYCFDYSSKKKPSNSSDDNRIPPSKICSENLKAFMKKQLSPSEGFRNTFDYSFFRKYNP